LEVSYENALRLIAWLHTIDRDKNGKDVAQKLVLPKCVISDDPHLQDKRLRTFAIQTKISPQTYLLLRLYIVKLFNRTNYSDTILAIQLVEALFHMPHLTISFGFFPDIAFTNTKDQIFLNHHLYTEQFEDSPAHFEKVPAVSHLALVVIHELGHILFGPTEEEADEFVNDFFKDIASMPYILTEEEQQQTKPEPKTSAIKKYNTFRNASGSCASCYLKTQKID
jgi:hypothetical protein